MSTEEKTHKEPVDTDEIGMIAALLGNAVLDKLDDYASEHNIFGYIGALSEISEWAHAFYDRYYERMSDWCSFEETAENIYDAISWDDFLFAWGQDRLRDFIAIREHGPVTLPPMERRNTPRIIIELEDGRVSRLCSNTPLQYVVVNRSGARCEQVETFRQPDAVTRKLHTLYSETTPWATGLRAALEKIGF